MAELQNWTSGENFDLFFLDFIWFLVCHTCLICPSDTKISRRYFGALLRPSKGNKKFNGTPKFEKPRNWRKENWADWNRGRLLAVSLSFAFKGFPNLSCFHIHLNKEGFLGWSCTCCFQLFTRVDGCFCEQFYWLFGLFLYNLALSPYGLSIFFF